MRELSCAACVELGAEVALGAADAEDRADVLAHVEHCAACGAHLASMTDVADGLAALVPSEAPPAGFEARVLDALARRSARATRTAPLQRLRARPAVAAAAVVVAAAIGAGGWLLGGATTSTPVVTASLVAHRVTVGRVVLVPGDHPWISMTLRTTSASAVRCEVRDASGRLRTLGTFTIDHGYGYWAAPLPYGVVVRSAELVTSNGTVLATASLGAS